MSHIISIYPDEQQGEVAQYTTQNLPEGEAREALYLLIFDAITKRNLANRKLRQLKAIVAALE